MCKIRSVNKNYVCNEKRLFKVTKLYGYFYVPLRPGIIIFLIPIRARITLMSKVEFWDFRDDLGPVDLEICIKKNKRRINTGSFIRSQAAKYKPDPERGSIR